MPLADLGNNNIGLNTSLISNPHFENAARKTLENMQKKFRTLLSEVTITPGLPPTGAIE
jgi:hypothetical protein